MNKKFINTIVMMTLGNRLNWEERIYKVRVKTKRSKVENGCQLYNTVTPYTRRRHKNIDSRLQNVTNKITAHRSI